VRGVQRYSRETILGCQGTWSENWHSDSLKKVKHTLSQVMKKMGDEVDDEDYEEVCSENQWVTRQSDSDTVY
jgi:hypothetical protein